MKARVALPSVSYDVDYECLARTGDEVRLMGASYITDSRNVLPSLSQKDRDQIASILATRLARAKAAERRL